MPRRRCPDRSAFTLVEAVVSLAITACAASALLLGMSTSLKTTTDLVDQTTALGIAQQLMDEIVGKRYCGVLAGEGPRQVTLGPAPAELSGASRLRFDDIDDYHGYNTRPAKDLHGVTLGADNGQGGTRNPGFQVPASYFDRWRQQVEVYYVSATDLAQRLPAGQTSDYRAIEVVIHYDDPASGSWELARVRRVIAYVPGV